ncbi:Uncharacterized protein APZ42_028600 [Daphnia magna]|uniref:Uncharacterized protein n=1 Tax=Daphnia magna TaxID=35525 RepID=A0A164Q7P4_9CRUS|nr:Uncharacterized protein APZ42_028600 [Daphnia magna]
MADRTKAQQHDNHDQLDIDIENVQSMLDSFSNISIIPNYPLLKKFSLPNMPTSYETVGILDGEIRKIENRTRQHIEYHFCLRNHTHWDWNDEILPDMLKCVFYTTSENFAAILPMETNIWVCGYFSPSGLFIICREVRLATDSDIAALSHYGIP